MDWRHLWTLIAIELVIAVAAEVLSRGSNLVEGLLGEHFRSDVAIRVMEHAATLDVAQFEDSETYDQLERARRESDRGIGFLIQILGLAQSMITVVSMVAGLILFVPWLVLLLFVSVLPAFFGETYFAALGYTLRHSWTQSRRMLDYLRYMAANDNAAKEVRLFGLSPYLIGRYREHAEGFLHEAQTLAIQRTSWPPPWRSLGRWASTAGTPWSSTTRSSATYRPLENCSRSVSSLS